MSHSARIWDYWLGGHDNYPVDHEVGEQIAEMLPDIVAQARANRLFLGRVLRYLAGEAGIRQFLDIGSGLPTADNTHEVTPAGGAGVPDRLRGQGSARAGARACPADQRA